MWHAYCLSICTGVHIERQYTNMIIVAHNIRSLHNVGAILRNAAAFGVKKVYLTGYTATPPRKEIAKVSLGAEELVVWQAGEVASVIDELRRAGYRVLGLETGDDAVDISTVQSGQIALVLGNEVEGIDSATRVLLDGLVVIPMRDKQSLNVSVASGVAMYALSCVKYCA